MDPESFGGEISKNIGDVKGRQYIGIVEVFRYFVVCLDANLLGLHNIKQRERGLLSKGCSSIHAENSDLTRVTARYCRVLLCFTYEMHGIVTRSYL